MKNEEFLNIWIRRSTSCFVEFPGKVSVAFFIRGVSAEIRDYRQSVLGNLSVTKAGMFLRPCAGGLRCLEGHSQRHQNWTQEDKLCESQLILLQARSPLCLGLLYRGCTENRLLTTNKS